MHLTSCFSSTIEHFYIMWLVLLGKKGSFSHFKTLYEVNTSSGEYSPFHHEIFESSAERLSSLTFPHFPPQNKRLSVSWQQKNKFMESGREEMWQHVAPKTYALFFFTDTIQSPSTVSSKTHYALNNGFETRHYLEFNVLLFWGTICTIIIGQPGLVSVVLVWKHSKSGLQVSELREILLLGDTGLVPRTVEENSWKKWLCTLGSRWNLQFHMALEDPVWEATKWMGWNWLDAEGERYIVRATAKPRCLRRETMICNYQQPSVQFTADMRGGTTKELSSEGSFGL